jgi:Integrase core domain
MGRAERHYLHVVIDDHSRYLYVERHPREDVETNARTLDETSRVRRRPG